MLTVKIAVGALAATVLAGTGIERFGDSAKQHVSQAETLRPSAELVAAPVYAPFSVLPSWVSPWKAAPPMRLEVAFPTHKGHHAGVKPAKHGAAGPGSVGTHSAVLVATARTPGTGAGPSTPHKTTHSGSSQPAAGGPRTSWHSTTWVHQVTAGNGKTTTRTTTTRTTTVGDKTNHSTHSQTTVTPPAHRSAPVAATPKPVHSSTPTQTSAPSTSRGAATSGATGSSNGAGSSNATGPSNGAGSSNATGGSGSKSASH